MAKTRVIGIGSPFGADQLGWLVIDALYAKRSLPDIELLHCRQPAELPQLLAGCDKVILVDAMQAGDPAGTLRRFGPADLPAVGLAVSSHGFGVSEGVRLAATLGCQPAELVILGLEISQPEQPPARAWVDKLARAVRAEIMLADTESADC